MPSLATCSGSCSSMAQHAMFIASTCKHHTCSRHAWDAGKGPMTSKLATDRQLALWAKDLAQLEQQSKPQTIIGVFGSTGAHSALLCDQTGLQM